MHELSHHHLFLLEKKGLRHHDRSFYVSNEYAMLSVRRWQTLPPIIRLCNINEMELVTIRNHDKEYDEGKCPPKYDANCN